MGYPLVFCRQANRKGGLEWQDEGTKVRLQPSQRATADVQQLIASKSNRSLSRPLNLPCVVSDNADWARLLPAPGWGLMKCCISHCSRRCSAATSEGKKPASSAAALPGSCRRYKHRNRKDVIVTMDDTHIPAFSPAATPGSCRRCSRRVSLPELTAVTRQCHSAFRIALREQCSCGTQSCRTVV